MPMLYFNNISSLVFTVEISLLMTIIRLDSGSLLVLVMGSGRIDTGLSADSCPGGSCRHRKEASIVEFSLLDWRQCFRSGPF